MDNINFFKDLFESIADCRKTVLLIFSIKDDNNLLKEIRCSKKDIIQLSLKFKNILLEQHEKS